MAGQAAVVRRELLKVVATQECTLEAELTAAGGAAVARVLASVTGPGDELAGAEGAMRDAMEQCWTQLHVGQWRDVRVCWRRAYAALALLRALLDLLRGDWVAALRLADLALLMGDASFHACAQLAVTASVSHVVRAPPLPWPERAPLPVPPALLRYPDCVAGASTTDVLPSLTDFERLFLRPGRATVLRQLAAQWPAVRLWRGAAHLDRVLGPRLVPVELGGTYMDAEWSQSLMTFADFYRDYVASPERHERPRGYLAQTRLQAQVPALLRDVLVPDYCCMGPADAPPTEMNVWFGPEDTVSPLHTDPRDNIFCQLVGSKVVLLFDPSDSACLYPGAMANTARVDAAAPDAEAFPLFARARTGAMVVLRAGDALFIPRGVWHYVRALQPSWSASFWFG